VTRVVSIVWTVALALFIAVTLVGIAILMFCRLVVGFRTGSLRGRGVFYSRRDEPILFWMLAATYAGFVAAFLWGCAALALYIVSHR
jgi:hypothetical protein